MRLNTRRIEPDDHELLPRLASQLYAVAASSSRSRLVRNLHHGPHRGARSLRAPGTPTCVLGGHVDRNELEPQPIIRAAIRWLRANPPPPPERVSVVHGDYRVGNFLYTKEGIHGIVDWEMAHLGDPLEDLAWSFMELSLGVGR